MYIYIFLSFLLFTLYLFLILNYWISWKNSKEQVFRKIPNIKVSLIIAFKDEEKNLAFLIKDILVQSYQNIEVILVNDHSIDKGLQLCEKIKSEKIKVFSLPDDLKGKKQAIAHGIAKSAGDFIVTTDADCRLQKDWILTIAQAFEQEKADFISAAVWMNHQDFLGEMQELEFASLVASGAASIFKNNAIMCNAANMAFRRELYLNNKDIWKSSYQSGDDIMLLLRAKKQRKKIIFLKNKKAVVYTSAQKTLKKFIVQRKRWASKSKFYNDFSIIYTALLILLINIGLLIAIFYDFYFFIVLFLIKSIPDFLFLNSFYHFYHKKMNIYTFLLVQLLYPFYILWSSTGVLFHEKWK